MAERNLPREITGIPKPGTFLGRRIKDIRKARNMSLRELSDASGLSVSHLSQTERGLGTPSIEALHQIAGALGAGISWFFSERSKAGQNPDEEGYVVRKDARWEINFGDGMRDEILSPNLSRHMQMMLARFEPGSFNGETYSHPGEKAGIVLSGVFELTVGTRKFLLQEGDSFAFDSIEPHRYGNPGDKETAVIWMMTPPRI